jgi:hypothetical protein
MTLTLSGIFGRLKWSGHGALNIDSPDIGMVSCLPGSGHGDECNVLRKLYSALVFPEQMKVAISLRILKNASCHGRQERITSAVSEPPAPPECLQKPNVHFESTLVRTKLQCCTTALELEKEEEITISQFRLFTYF